VRYDNPAHCLKRQAERQKKLKLPSRIQFEAFLKEIERGGSGKVERAIGLLGSLA
jgi:hypothetical protein